MNNLRFSKVLPLALTVVLGAQLSGLAAMAFTDTTNHWAQPDIQQLSRKNIINGYSDGSFQPEKSITRAEFATILVKALNLPTTGNTGVAQFNDVPSGHWAAPYIDAVKSAGLINGYPGNLFMPNRNITRTEVMTILSSIDKTAMPADFSVTKVLSTYQDGFDVPTWAQEAVAEAAYTRVMENYPNRQTWIEPNRNATRAEVAAMLVNMDDNLLSSVKNLANPVTQPVSQSDPLKTSHNSALVGHVLVVPDKTEFAVTVNTPISTTVSKIGDKVEATLDKPLLSSDNQVIVPANSKFVGNVSLVEAAGITGKSARMSVDFNELVLPNGERVPVKASIATDDGALIGGTTKGRILGAVGRTAIGAGLGAALGTQWDRFPVVLWAKASFTARLSVPGSGLLPRSLIKGTKSPFKAENSWRSS